MKHVFRLMALMIGVVVLLMPDVAFAGACEDTYPYRSVASGNWNTNTTWQCYNGTSWVTPDSGQYPKAISNVVTIQSGTNVMLNVTDFLGTMTVNPGGNLVIAGNYPLNAVATINGTLTLTSGTLTTNNLLTMGNGATIVRDVGTLSAAPSIPVGLINVTYTGTTAVTTALEFPATINNLTINKSGGVTLSASRTVNGIVALNAGNLTAGTGSNQLFLASTATVTAAGGGDVIGDVVRNHAFTLGTTYTFNNPNTSIQFISGTPPTSVTINLTLVKPSAFATAIPRTYQITPSNSSTFAATLSLRYANSEKTGMTEANLKLWRYNSMSSRWVPHGGAGHPDATNPYVSLTGMTDFSSWAISDKGTTTPVKLSSFSAQTESDPMLPVAVGAIALLGGAGGILLAVKKKCRASL